MIEKVESSREGEGINDAKCSQFRDIYYFKDDGSTILRTVWFVNSSDEIVFDLSS